MITGLRRWVRVVAARRFTHSELVEFWSDAMGRGDYQHALMWCDAMDEQLREEAERENA